MSTRNSTSSTTNWGGVAFAVVVYLAVVAHLFARLFWVWNTFGDNIPMYGHTLPQRRFWDYSPVSGDENFINHGMGLVAALVLLAAIIAVYGLIDGAIIKAKRKKS